MNTILEDIKSLKKHSNIEMWDIVNDDIWVKDQFRTGKTLHLHTLHTCSPKEFPSCHTDRALLKGINLNLQGWKVFDTEIYSHRHVFKLYEMTQADRFLQHCGERTCVNMYNGKNGTINLTFIKGRLMKQLDAREQETLRRLSYITKAQADYCDLAAIIRPDIDIKDGSVPKMSSTFNIKGTISRRTPNVCASDSVLEPEPDKWIQANTDVDAKSEFNIKVTGRTGEPMQDLINYIKTKRYTHNVKLYTLDDREFYIKWDTILSLGDFDRIKNLIRDLESMNKRGFQACVIYNLLSTQGVFAPALSSPVRDYFDTVMTEPGVFKTCPDCKDGFYYPLVGEREPCETCN